LTVSNMLRELARNLYWTWHPEVVAIFRDLDLELWREVNHNPIEMLERLKDQDIHDRAAHLVLEARITHMFKQLQAYTSTEAVWGATHTGPLRARPVAYFSAEFGLHESIPIYSGGLGVLAGDHLKAASDLNIPIVGVGLFYGKGYFRQALDSKGWQEEHYDAPAPQRLPLEPVEDDKGERIEIELHAKELDEPIRAVAWTADVGRNRLVLLDTNIESNADKVRGLTSELYGGDDRTRIRQEYLLGVGGLRVLRAMGIEPGVLHLNEGHSAFAVLEQARHLMARDGQAFENVKETAASATVLTTHTSVEAGQDRFDPELVEQTIGPLRERIELSEYGLLALGRVNEQDEQEPFCMTVLGLKMSRARNAVSSLHGRITRAMWHGLWPERPEHEVPIGHITNGVHVPSQLAPGMDGLFREWFGQDWKMRISEPKQWVLDQPADGVQLWETSQRLKTRLIEFIGRRFAAQCRDRDEDPGENGFVCPDLDPAALTIGFARRFADYKRAYLILNDMDRLREMINSEDRPIQLIFAGKAHPADDAGKEAIQRIFETTRNPDFKGRIVFIENYDINVARHLVQGVDLWLNTPCRPLEACGTSGQKAVFNCGLNLSTLDGWWAEAYDGNNGFAVGWGGEHVSREKQDEIDTGSLFDTLENEVIPMYYDRNDNEVPHRWIEHMKNALRTLGWRFNAQRMVREYAESCYLPAVGGSTTSFQPPHRACHNKARPE